jgi:glycosyltransferase involved in cell wall biosynthesis
MSRVADPLVSVVTPFYNAERFLAECIESVLEQTYRNFEYVLVNNCSTDRSAAIARRYADKDRRLRLIENTEFLPAIQNWNHALRQISPSSQYVKMIFADDCLFPDCLQQMVRIAEAHPGVGLVGAYRLAGTVVNNDGLPFPSHCIPGRKIVRETLLGGPYVFGSPSSVLMRADLVRRRDPFFQDLPGLTDMESFYYLLRHSDFAFVHQVLTRERPRPDSLTSSLAFRGTNFPEMLQILRAHGSFFLTPAEQAECERRWTRAYYFYLGQNLFYFRDRSFWNYHRSQMSVLGRDLSYPRLFWAALHELARVLFRPLVTFAKALRFTLRVRRKSIAGNRPAPVPSESPRG